MGRSTSADVVVDACFEAAAELADAPAVSKKRGESRRRVRETGALGGAALEPSVANRSAVGMGEGKRTTGGSRKGECNESIRGTGGAEGASGVRGWMAWARGVGLSLGEVVLELHVRQGVPLLQVAGALGVRAEVVEGLWEEARGLLVARALRSEAEIGGLRERIGMTLWQTVESTFPVMELGRGAADNGDGGCGGGAAAAAGDDEVADVGSLGVKVDAGVAKPPAPAVPAAAAVPAAPMLSVRLKALDQLTKLYDLNLSRAAEEEGETVPYAAPAEIAAAVRERVLGMWGRNL